MTAELFYLHECIYMVQNLNSRPNRIKDGFLDKRI